MFTGIIDHTAKITKIEKTANTSELTIKTRFQELVLGESITVDGVCLTVTGYQHGIFKCQLSPETCAITIAADYDVGKLVNVERAVCLGDRMGGHIVTGHVDQIATLTNKQSQGDYIAMIFSAVSAENTALLVTKGSITINGISLTINKVFADGFEVMLIPHTLTVTNLGELVVGDSVNVEFDYLAKTVQSLLRNQLILTEKTYV